jgi:hypothetical protein
MWRMILGVAVAVALGCGGSTPDYAPNFAGTWLGTVTATDVGTGETLAPYSVEAIFIITSLNALRFEACPGLTGPTVAPSSASTFASVAPFSCEAEGTTDCNAVVVTYNSLSGSVDNATLQFTTNITAAGCGDTVTLNLAFTDGVKQD